MNKKEISNNFKARGYNMTGWCRVHDVTYSALYQLLRRHDSKPQFTLRQQQLIEKLKADGLYVSACEEQP